MHYKRQNILEHFNLGFGISIIILSTASAILSFSFLAVAHDWVGYIAGFCGTVALALATIQTFRDYRGEALNHLAAAKQYNALKSEIEQVKAIPPNNWDSFMTDYRRRWEVIDREASPIPYSYYSARGLTPPPVVKDGS